MRIDVGGDVEGRRIAFADPPCGGDEPDGVFVVHVERQHREILGHPPWIGDRGSQRPALLDCFERGLDSPAAEMEQRLLGETPYRATNITVLIRTGMAFE